jgi:hypothetical protein
MEDTEENSYSYYRLYEKIALVSLLNNEMRKPSTPKKFSGINFFNFFLIYIFVFFLLGSLSCVNSDINSKKKQHNINNNNNNNISPLTTDEQNSSLQFYVFTVNRERNLHLSTNSNDKRLLIFYNISNGLYKTGLRNGELIDSII